MSLPLPDPALVHLLGSLLCAGLAWGAGNALHRWLQLSAAATRYWLCLWLLAVLPPLLAMALAVAAPSQVAALPSPLALPIALDLDAGGPAITTGITAAPRLGWPTLAQVLWATYLTGAGIALLRLLRGTLAVARIARAAPSVPPAAWRGAASRDYAGQLARQGIRIRLTQHAVSPFAVRWPRPTIVLPATALQAFSDRQLRLVLGHEAAHLARRDPQRAGAMAVVDAVLWFNPFVRRITARVQMAVELRCDALALGSDDTARRDFAAAYLQALRMAGHGATPASPSALTHRDAAGHRLRIQHMLGGDAGRTLPLAARTLLGAGALGIGAMLALVQAGTAATPLPLGIVAIAASPARATPDASLLAAATMRFAAPLAQSRITGHYGDAGGIRQRAHRGIDFGARVGTPVLAPADATVVAATPDYPGGAQYGTVVVLDHGNGWQTLFAHLDGTDVQVGQQVRSGDPIARTGHSGRVTGPHLHMEMLFNGERIDPQRRLP